MITLIMKNIMLRAVLYSNFLKNAEFVCSVDNISPLSGEKIFEQGGDQKYKIIKFRFAPKLPSICFNQK